MDIIGVCVNCVATSNLLMTTAIAVGALVLAVGRDVVRDRRSVPHGRDVSPRSCVLPIETSHLSFDDDFLGHSAYPVTKRGYQYHVTPRGA